MSAPGPLDAEDRLLDRHGAVDPAVRGGGLDHRVLAGHLVRGDGHRAGRGDVGEHVEVAQRGLDHDDVGALARSSATSRGRLAPVRRVHLVGPAVALERRLDGLAERPVERGRVLGGVGQDARCRSKPGVVERVADGADLAVHHPARPEHVGAGVGLRERHGDVADERRVVVDDARRRPVQHAAVAVVGELVEAEVGHDDERARRPPRPRRAIAALRMPSGSVAPEPTASRAAGRRTA